MVFHISSTVAKILIARNCLILLSPSSIAPSAEMVRKTSRDTFHKTALLLVTLILAARGASYNKASSTINNNIIQLNEKELKLRGKLMLSSS